MFSRENMTLKKQQEIFWAVFFVVNPKGFHCTFFYIEVTKKVFA